MSARSGHIPRARTLLEDLSASSRADDPFHQAPLSETRAFIQHLEDPRNGAAEYAKALDFQIATGRTVEIARLCSVAPFELSECRRLGYPNEPL